MLDSQSQQAHTLHFAVLRFTSSNPYYYKHPLILVMPKLTGIARNLYYMGECVKLSPNQRDVLVAVPGIYSKEEVQNAIKSFVEFLERFSSDIKTVNESEKKFTVEYTDELGDRKVSIKNILEFTYILPDPETDNAYEVEDEEHFVIVSTMRFL